MENRTTNIPSNERHLNECIDRAMEKGMPNEALCTIARYIKTAPFDARLYYLRGKVHMKCGEWDKAISSFKQAVQLDRESPAAEMLQMLTDIMNFYNKDMYNQ